MDRIRWKLSEFHKLLHFRDHMIGCGRHYSIEIPRRFPIHEISPPISAPGFDERKIATRSEEHTSELQSHVNLVCRLLLEKKNKHTSPSLPTPCPITDYSYCHFFITWLSQTRSATCSTSSTLTMRSS